ncbi:MAG TPA: DUF2339 domain-containing protein [Candidatus Paceibacterota bacterium]|nr:DUF2339 domain-containing protein [Verrucomicrobiota bacterium]HSA12436.1 DUF2339 domain-containing protein [Candidatus Paceibacterota bacterium]
MNEPERLELERLKERQARLAHELAQLSAHLSSLEERLNVARPDAAALAAPRPERPPNAQQPAAKPVATPSTAVPPIIRPEPVVPRISVRIPPALTKVSTVPPAATPPNRPPVVTTATTGEKGSFEMRLGTYWLVRVGIVMVLTALVFFGNLAYQNFISQLGPGGKVALLYLASAALLLAGGWWQRRAVKESLKNYAQVLFAGGLAAVYFTTYAAHHIERLRIIASPGLDGGLLLAWAAFMVWIADGKKSEVLALFAVGLAYYTSIITRVGYFTLYSNLVLTAAAVFFLVRNRWATLTFASLAATYTAYAFWRFFSGSHWHWASPEQGLWAGTWFLISYWLLFTAAVFLSRDEKFAGQNRASFLTLNNGAFFAGFVLTMLQVQTGGFWKFALSYGVGLLVLAEAARRFLAAEAHAKNSYLTQGLLLVTVGFIARFSGLQLALILAVESVFLLIAGQHRQNLVLRIGAYISAALAVGWGMDGMQEFDTPGLWLGVGLGALMMVNTVLAHRQTAAATEVLLRPQPSYFTVLALVIWLVVTWDNTSQNNFPLVLAMEALLLTLSIYVLRVREVTLLSQGYLLLAQLAWVFNASAASPLPPWWNPAVMIAITLGLSHWWQRETILQLRSQIGVVWQGLYALATVGVLYGWLEPKIGAPAWLAVTSLLAVALTAYGVFTRAWLLAACAQIFMLVSGVQFALQLSEAKPAWALALLPIAALGLLSYGTTNWFARKPDPAGRVSQPLLQIALVYRWVALAMSMWWVSAYIPSRERIWLLALLGLCIFLWAGWQRNREALLFSVPYTAVALGLFWLPLIEAPRIYWPNLLAIIILLAQRQLARRLPDRYPLPPEIHTTAILVGGLSLWRFLSLWVLEQQPGGFYLTAGWSLLALGFFTVGIVLRERMYRWMGLGVLACALGRVVIFDVWKLETLYRILSFMALGIVLLVLGFIYNKYQEKLKEWL